MDNFRTFHFLIDDEWTINKLIILEPFVEVEWTIKSIILILYVEDDGMIKPIILELYMENDWTIKLIVLKLYMEDDGTINYDNFRTLSRSWLNNLNQ